MHPAELLQSSTFRLTLLYMTLVAAAMLALLGFIYWSTVGFMSSQVDDTIEAEIVGLAEQYRARGLNGLVRTINDRIERNPRSSSIYLFASPNLQPLAGNLNGWPTGTPDAEGWLDFDVDDPNQGLKSVNARARVFALQGNFNLLVGRDVRELQSMQRLIEQALLWGVGITIALAALGGFMLSRTTLKRLEDINDTSREIMAGDLSRRVPTRGTSDDFDELAGNLNAMLDEIERLMGGIRHVSDNIAHDLRTPLTRLRHKLETLRDGSLDDAERDVQIEESIQQADQLLATFSALLRIARIEAGGYRLQIGEIDLGALIHDAAELYEAATEEKHLKLSVRVDGHPSIQGDRDLIFQAVANLIDNALKFTPAGGRIEVSASEAGGRIFLRVADSGPGIPAEDRTAVLKRFHRLENSRSTPGSGLGLSLVSAVAKMHQAELELSNNAPGLKACLIFPVAS
ncbi:MAG: ATP-binding protein [Pseudomonadales bacterium]